MDKLLTSPRVAAAPLIARVISGALSGAAACAAEGKRAGVGILLGSLSALGAAFGFYYLRRKLAAGTGVPEQVVGLAEDALLIALGSKVFKR